LPRGGFNGAPVFIGISYPEILVSPNLQTYKNILSKAARSAQVFQCMMKGGQVMKKTLELLELVVFVSGFYLILTYICVCLTDHLV
jgi:hypothetical protein